MTMALLQNVINLTGVATTLALALASYPANLLAQTPTERRAAVTDVWSADPKLGKYYCVVLRDTGDLEARLFRDRYGYKITLVSDRWSLPPGQEFPVRLVAGATTRDGRIWVISDHSMSIHLPGDAEFIGSLRQADVLELQQTLLPNLRVPFAGGAAAIAEIDECDIRSSRPRRVFTLGPWEVEASYDGFEFSGCIMRRGGDPEPSFVRKHNEFVILLQFRRGAAPDIARNSTLELKTGSAVVSAPAEMRGGNIWIRIPESDIRTLDLRGNPTLAIAGAHLLANIPMDQGPAVLNLLEACYWENTINGHGHKLWFGEPTRRAKETAP